MAVCERKRSTVSKIEVQINGVSQKGTDSELPDTVSPVLIPAQTYIETNLRNASLWSLLADGKQHLL